MSGFPKLPKSPNSEDSKSDERRKEWQVLYRLEGATLLVQSGIRPDWNQLPTGYHPDREIRELDFQTIQAGECFRFRLVANPVHQRTRQQTDKDGNPIFKTDKNGQPILNADGSKKTQQKTWRRLITKEDDQIQWLTTHLKGATLEECYVGSPSQISREQKSSIIRTVQFDGVLKVVNPTEFLDVLTNGIGRGRSYGCGLLSIAKLP